jgi:ArsR family transcriptional regulator
MAKQVTMIEGCCAPLLHKQIGKSDAVQHAGAFKAIADPAQPQLRSFIAAPPSGEACVCNLTEPLELTQPTVSHHLNVLHGAGMLARDRRGTWVHYRIVPERLGALRDALAPPPRLAKTKVR